MPKFKAKRFDGADNPIDDFVEVEAENELEAAEKVHGGPLSETDENGKLRVVVMAGARPALPVEKSFYEKVE